MIIKGKGNNMNTLEQQYNSAVFQLFKALPVDMTREHNNVVDNEKNVKEYGYYVTSRAAKHVKNLEYVINVIFPQINIPLKPLNETFHKSFEKVKNTPIETLVYQQILHYMTTYGAEEIDAFQEDCVYIPLEEIKEFDSEDRIFVHLVDCITYEEVLERVSNLLYSGVALSKNTLNNIDIILDFHSDFKLNVDNVKNKEYKCLLCVKHNIIPSNPIEFLRLLVFSTTNSTMLIKSKSAIATIKYSMTQQERKDKVCAYFNKYIEENTMKPLASIFFRYKPLFLAFKCDETAKTINKLRKKANTYHKPKKSEILDIVTSCNSVDINELKKELTSVTLFKKVSLMNALLLRENTENKSFVYVIRNGGVYAKERNTVSTPSMSVRYVVLQSIIDEVKEKVNGKKIFIQPNVDFAFPTSEKNFISGIPFGSVFNIPKSDDNSIMCGVHWENERIGNTENRVDLDLHASNMSESIGWDSSYYNDNKQIIFTGDMTDAPRKRGGASEIVYIDESTDEVELLFTLNYFNSYEEDFDFPCHLLLGYTHTISNNRNAKKAIVEAGKLCAYIPFTIHKRNNMIGFLKKNGDEAQFTFMNLAYGDDISYRKAEHQKTMLDYFHKQVQTQLRLKDILALSGAVLVDNPMDADIVLDLQTMGETSILDMFV